MTPRLAALFAILAFLSACGTAPPPPPAPVPEAPSFTQEGLASWYGKAHEGHKTASGEPFDMHAMTAAHRSLPFDTILRVTDLDTGRMVKVRINDRGPYAAGRIIDLSAKAAGALGITEGGVGRVRIEVFASDRGRSTEPPRSEVGY
ncbi:MAG: septal ring lytic transglycosylase RlpA family protein [Alphaproteobacteria bacterium]|nr:septal ring lytic transglycosylase RlpA family protein [Alphaproteobacteria bacterium]